MNAPAAPHKAAPGDGVKSEFVASALDGAAYYAALASRAARERNRIVLAVRIRQTRLCLRAAVATLRDDGGEP
jgi:hypothetical protein